MTPTTDKRDLQSATNSCTYKNLALVVLATKSPTYQRFVQTISGPPEDWSEATKSHPSGEECARCSGEWTGVSLTLADTPNDIKIRSISSSEDPSISRILRVGISILRGLHIWTGGCPIALLSDIITVPR